jgi:hypothetical protein
VIDGVTRAGHSRCLDLDHYPPPGDGHYEIDLTAVHSCVALHYAGATRAEEKRSHMLAEPTPLIVAQIAEVGSNSSMFTSRNVITLTLLTNLAGRYMSHTHASFNSSSK